jgi:DNA transposition AAA+ family ATPase
MVLNEQQQTLAVALLQALRTDMEKLGMTKENGAQKQYARQVIKISDAALSQVLNEDWHLIGEERFEMLCKHFRLVALAPTDWKIMPTANFKTVQATCADAEHRCRFLAVRAPTGSGKTTALEVYAKNNNALYVLCDALMNVRDLVEEIQRTYKDKTKGSLRKRVLSIAAYLNKNKCLLILDDFGKLNDDSYRTLQLIYDLTNSVEYGRNCGIIISGVEYMETKIQKGVKKESKCFAELYSRIEIWQGLKDVHRNDVTKFCELFGITDEGTVDNITAKVLDFRQLRAEISNVLFMRTKG